MVSSVSDELVVVDTSEEDCVMSTCELRDEFEEDEGNESVRRSSDVEVYVGFRDE